MISPSLLYLRNSQYATSVLGSDSTNLIWVNARSCPCSNIGLMFATQYAVGDEEEGAIYKIVVWYRSLVIAGLLAFSQNATKLFVRSRFEALL